MLRVLAFSVVCAWGCEQPGFYPTGGPVSCVSGVVCWRGRSHVCFLQGLSGTWVVWLFSLMILQPLTFDSGKIHFCLLFLSRACETSWLMQCSLGPPCGRASRGDSRAMVQGLRGRLWGWTLGPCPLEHPGVHCLTTRLWLEGPLAFLAPPGRGWGVTQKRPGPKQTMIGSSPGASQAWGPQREACVDTDGHGHSREDNRPWPA